MPSFVGKTGARPDADGLRVKKREDERREPQYYSIYLDKEELGWYNKFRFRENSFPSATVADPDLVLLHRTSELNKTPVFAIEVGSSEPSKDLEEKGRRLLRATNVKAVLLIDIKEYPAYENPTGEYKGGSKQGLFKEDNIKAYKDAYTEQGSEAKAETRGDNGNPYSPTYMYSIAWVNELNVVAHVLAKDSGSGEIVEKSKKVLSTKHGALQLPPERWSRDPGARTHPALSAPGEPDMR